nr:integrase, catalytic region, zinc finger, CCHC-type, peptidase aspartic, catalytic [Tanacetum cinerariifolium]
MENKLFAYQDTISIVKQQKDAQIKLYKSREDKELEKVIELENKVKVLDNIVYKTSQSVQTMNLLNNKCRTSFVKPEYLKKAKQANPRLYDIGCYNDNLALMLTPDSDEVIRLEKESRSKLNDLIKPFDYNKLNNLYDLFVPQREKSSEQLFSERSRISHIHVQNEKRKESFNKQTTLLEKRMDKSIPFIKNCKSSLEIIQIKININTIITGVELCKQKIANRTYIGYIDPFIKNTIEQNFCPVISQINAGLDQFLECLNEEMVVDLRYFNSLELEVDSLTSQLETQRTQFVNEIDLLSREYYYADHMHAILGVYTDLDKVTNLQCDYLELLEKCKGLETELSKSKMMSKSFESVQKHAINLELEVQQCKEKIKNDMSFKVIKSKDFCKEREQYFEIQDLKAQLQDKGIVISESNSFVRKDFSKSTSVTQTHVSNDFSKPVTAQTLPSNMKFVLKNMNVLAPEMYKLHTDHTQTRTSQLSQDSKKTNKRVSFSTGVILTTSVSRPQLKSNPQGDRVMHNNSQGKKKEVEDHRRSVKLSKNRTSVTAYNDSLNAKTLNVTSVFAMCDKCVLIDKHDMCILKSVDKPLKETIASESNNKPRNFTRKLYERVSKTCSWWYPKFTPSGYIWKPKSRKGNVNPNSKMMSKSFESVQKHAINLELELQQCKEKIKDDMSFKVNKSKDFCKEREQYFEIQDLKAQLQDKGIVISELKKLMEKHKGKSVDTKFEKTSVIRQPNAFKSQRPSILGKPTTFSNSFIRKDFSKSTSVTQTHVSNDFSKPVTAQILHANKKSILKNTNVLNPRMYTDHTQTRTSKLPPDSRKTNKRMTFSTGVIPSTSVSRPQLKSNPMEDRVLRNNSRGKKQEVEDHRRNVKLPKNKTAVTACNDSLNAKTLNVKSVSMCDKCVLHDKHDTCVLKSVAKPIKRTVASESNKKPKNFTRKIYEHVSKTCSWWYPKSTPPGYIWKPKSKTVNVNPNLVEIVLFIVDSGCSKHMTGNLKVLINFMEKFLEMVKFRNDQIAPILGYGDLVQGAITIKRVYYVERLNYNLFSVRQFCDADLEVAFRKSTCFIRDLQGNDFLSGSRGTDLYSITLQDTNSSNLICLVAKATSSQAWLWNRRLSHLNFDTINLLS